MVERYPERHLLAAYSDERLMQMVANYRETELSNIGINFKAGGFSSLVEKPRVPGHHRMSSKQRLKNIIEDLRQSRQFLT